LFDRLLVAGRELNLPLQHGLLGARWQWRPVHGVRGRNVQESDRSSRVHPLSSKLLLAFGELNFNELYLQRRLVGG
jgi:hypothetical protein